MEGHLPPYVVICLIGSAVSILVSVIAVITASQARMSLRLYRFQQIELGVIERTSSPPPDGMLADTYYRGDMGEYVFEKLCLGHYQKEIGK